MRSGNKQFAVIIILMLALFMQMEGLLPNILANSAVPVILTENIEGMEFRAEIDDNSCSTQEELLIRASFTNKSKEPISYYAGNTVYGMASVVDASLICNDGISRFSSKESMYGVTLDAVVLEGLLLPGSSTNTDFKMYPYYKENGSIRLAEPGRYTLTLYYTKSINEVVKAELPVTIYKRFGKLYIKG